MKDIHAETGFTNGQLRILQAVAALLENPSKKMTIANIAAQLQVTEGAIYRHYKSKDDIFAALVNYIETNIITPLNAVQTGSAATQERLQSVFQQYMMFLEGHPGLARLILGHGADIAPGLADRIMLINAKMRAQLAQILKVGQASNHIQSNVTAEQATELFYGLITGAAMSYAFGFPLLPEGQRWQIFSHAVLK